ncbi:MAG TPA: DUF3034 family protein [Arenimonas sp.]|nr:DUF3034 family protein [Arenimonas sp.]HOZ05601.1 DUF3034 family protein [Arenimonas sp.]HPO24731.1 DUF3034 family protein [Arenimonas sp.]HPW33141.1 DUF3034 family protein [Arenimonas sp.]
MSVKEIKRKALCLLLISLASNANAADQEDNDYDNGGKLLLTGGVTQLEGAAGGGLTPWAVIGGYGTDDEIGANAFYTRVNTGAYHLDDAGVMIGIYNRVELSFAQQRFNTEQVGGLLGLGDGFAFQQNVIGVKVRVAGDLVVNSDSWMPQISVGVQHKKNNQPAVLAFVGAKDDSGTDYYVTATKLFLADGLLINGTLRFTKANQIGILGFGGDKNDSYKPQLEISAAYLLNQKWAVGAEYRMKPDNLGIAREDNWFDAFVAYAPNKHVSFTVAYADLGNIVIKDNQRGVYASVQVGF